MEISDENKQNIFDTINQEIAQLRLLKIFQWARRL